MHGSLLDTLEMLANNPLKLNDTNIYFLINLKII